MSHIAGPVFFDTHCHINHRDLHRDLDAVLARARSAGVREMLVVGYDLPSSREAVRLANAHEGLWAAVGVHPHDAKTYDDNAERELATLAEDPRVLAVGEIGLDYYRDLSPRDVQVNVFDRQLKLAEQIGKPVILHHRDAQDDTYRILSEWASRIRGCVVHCFNDTAEWARRWLDLGFVLGIGGPLTYKKNDELRMAIAGIPRDRLLLETDCPYLTPHPHRGKRNEPAYLTFIAEEVAHCWQSDPATVTTTTTANAHRALGLDPE